MYLQGDQSNCRSNSNVFAWYIHKVVSAPVRSSHLEPLGKVYFQAMYFLSFNSTSGNGSTICMTALLRLVYVFCSKATLVREDQGVFDTIVHTPCV